MRRFACVHVVVFAEDADLRLRHVQELLEALFDVPHSHEQYGVDAVSRQRAVGLGSAARRSHRGRFRRERQGVLVEIQLEQHDRQGVHIIGAECEVAAPLDPRAELSQQSSHRLGVGTQAVGPLHLRHQHLSVVARQPASHFFVKMRARVAFSVQGQRVSCEFRREARVVVCGVPFFWRRHGVVLAIVPPAASRHVDLERPG
mmetsp:Transcript_27517/g.110265  ORF Transcript_27517/g.110265 Transcript_27517/m.110265 type:complete len:202 (+) Transcript_27517:248-853(+)